MTDGWSRPYRRSVGIWLLWLSWLLPLAARAGVRLPALVGSHMVVQRGRPVPVWGWADPGEVVQVSFRGQTHAAGPADATGRWQVALPPASAGGPYQLVVQGRTGPPLVLDDVLVGDVWLCAGQSNMQMPLQDPNPAGYRPVQQADQEIAAASYPTLRVFTVRQQMAAQPRAEAGGNGWQVCSPATAAGFSAVAYFFGRELTRRYRVPVGLVVSSWGGTPAEAWLSADALPPGEVLPPPPEPQQAPAVLYNGMVAPLHWLALRGVAWYQGETNVGRAAQYARLLPALITDWRRTFGQPALPFLVVQLANFQPVRPVPGPSGWAALREAQAAALTLPGTALATTIDLGEAADIHPRNKQEVGRRLALAAAHVAYGERRVAASGPALAGWRVRGSTVQLRFTGRGGRLAVRGDSLRGFAVAGTDRRFYWATARVRGRRVQLRCPQVPRPVAVRYAWADNPAAALQNRAGLPALPFRTDTWPD